MTSTRHLFDGASCMKETTMPSKKTGYDQGSPGISSLGSDPFLGNVSESEGTPIDSTLGSSVDAGYDGDSEHSSQAQGVKEKASAVTEQLKEKADLGKEKADAGLQKSAEGLQKVADKARAVGDDQSGTLGTVGTQAAVVLEKGADVLADRDTEQLVQDLEALVRRRPLESLVAAAGVGYLVARAMR